LATYRLSRRTVAFGAADELLPDLTLLVPLLLLDELLPPRRFVLPDDLEADAELLADEVELFTDELELFFTVDLLFSAD
jgi:hypothetical protein